MKDFVEKKLPAENRRSVPIVVCGFRVADPTDIILAYLDGVWTCHLPVSEHLKSIPNSFRRFFEAVITQKTKFFGIDFSKNQ